MPATTLDLREGRLDVLFRPGNSDSVTLTFPTGALTGLTLSALLNGVTLPLTQVGNVVTLTPTAGQTAAIAVGQGVRWSLSTQTGQVLISGLWKPQFDGSASTTGSVTVHLGSATVTVSVLTALVTSVNTRTGAVTGLAEQADLTAEAATRATADTTNATAIATETTRATAAEATLHAYVDSSVVGLWDDRGDYDASGNVFPTTGGSGSAGAIKKGDTWFVTVAGTLGGTAVAVGDVLLARVDSPGSTAGNWFIGNHDIGYTPENVANKDTDGTLAANSDTRYPSQKAVKTAIAAARTYGLFSSFAGGPPAIAAGTTVIQTTGYSVQGRGEAFYLYDAAVDGTYVTANPRTSFLALDGRGFKLRPVDVNALMFGAVGDGIIDDHVALQAFFDFCAATACNTANVDGAFSSSVALNYGSVSQVPVTFDFRGRFVLALTGSGTRALTFKSWNTGYWQSLRIIGTGSTGTYSSKTWQVGVYFDDSSRNRFGDVYCQYFSFAAVAACANNNTANDYGMLKALDCGSGARSGATMYGATTSWSNPVNAGTSGSTAQSTTINVSAQPPAYIGTGDYGAVGDSQYLIRITDIDGSTRLHYINSLDANAGTATVFPWISNTAVPGTADYVFGGALYLRGSDSNVATADMVDATRCGVALAATSLYAPTIKRVITQLCGSAIAFGRTPGGSTLGGKIDGAYFENNVEDIVLVCRPGTNAYNSVDSTYALTLAKCYSVGNARQTDNTFSSAFDGFLRHRLSVAGRITQWEKRSGGVFSGVAFELNRPDMVAPVASNAPTITFSPLDLDLHRLFGYDTARVIVVGTGTNGAPTGTCTFPCPAGWTINGSSSDATFSGFDGPAEFIYRFVKATLDITLTRVRPALGTASAKNVGNTVLDPGTGKLEYAWPFAGLVTGASKTYASTDRGYQFSRSNSGSAMSDTLPALTNTTADIGWSITIHNEDTALAAVLTMNASGGALFRSASGSTASTSPIAYGCRMTWVWTGTQWILDNGNANLLRRSGTIVTGEFPAFADTAGNVVTSSGVSAASITAYADGKVIDSIADADTSHAPSRNAVFDALALKADSSSLGTAAAANTGTGAGNVPTITQADARYAARQPATGTALSTTGTVTLDMSALHATYQKIALTGNLTLATSNRADGEWVTLILAAGGSSRTLAYPAWIALGASLPTTLAAGKTLVVTVRFTDTTDAAAVATASVQP